MQAPKKRGDENERRPSTWLNHNADTASTTWTRERHDKLIAALGDGWQPPRASPGPRTLGT